MKKKIAIIGAGIGGLTLANLLQKNLEFEFVIYEKSETLNLDEGFTIVSVLSLLWNIIILYYCKSVIEIVANKEKNKKK